MSTRERNPERSRERILHAAREEFAANGYAGARVEAIAGRAGLNKQLISHHFGGKQALYREVVNTGRARPGGDLAEAPREMPDALGRLFRRTQSDPQWVRFLLWEALAPTEDLPDESLRAQAYRDRIDWIVEQQSEGRLPAELDPGLLLLSLLGAAVYPMLLPQVCRMVTGEEPTSDGFAERYAEHLVALARLLGRDD
ncbi:MAG: TetR family transcriptional regulator [Actinomycetia bacterium]|nr:TetR family transcriptional regulator [Actinomycetes bacterium]